MAVQTKLSGGRYVYEARFYPRGTATPKKLGRFANKRQAERFEESVKILAQDQALGVLSANTRKWLETLSNRRPLERKRFALCSHRESNSICRGGNIQMDAVAKEIIDILDEIRKLIENGF